MSNATNAQSSSLEPRVAKLETGLEILTRDVTTLANVVREQGRNIENEIQKLAVGVTQAAAPRRTDWSTIISAVLLIMAIGSAVFWPLNQTSQNNKSEIQALAQDFKDHQQLQLHPVGQALLARIEEQVQVRSDAYTAELATLDRKLQTEYTLINAKIENQINALDIKVQLEMKLLGDTVDNRLDRLEQIIDR